MSHSDPPSSRHSGQYRAELITLVEDVERFSVPPVQPMQKDRCLLTVLTGPQRGSILSVDDSEVTVGRADEAGAPIADPSLSRVHARIFREGDSYFVEDAGSTNGTFVGDERIEGPARLEDGSRIRFGTRTVVKFSMQDPVEAAAMLRIAESALRDPLTHAYNRGIFDDRLEGEVAFSKRHGVPISLLLLDVDHFKSFNDTHGHQAGDMVLAAVAYTLQKAVRIEDLVARYGGEEFAIIARGTTEQSAQILANRLREKIERLKLPWGELTLKVTVSIGLCTLSSSQPFADAGALVAATDAALYAAKDAGRNRVVTYSQLEPPPPAESLKS